MASTSAVVYFKPQFSATEQAGRTTAAVFYLPFRDVSGVFSAGGAVSTQGSEISAKAMLPGPRVPLVDQAGLITPAWYRFFNWLLNDKLGGISAPSISDVSSSISSVQTTVTSTVSTVVALSAQTDQNAAALDTVREVAQNASLPGASQIPPISRTPLP